MAIDPNPVISANRRATTSRLTYIEGRQSRNITADLVKLTLRTGNSGRIFRSCSEHDIDLIAGRVAPRLDDGSSCREVGQRHPGLGNCTNPRRKVAGSPVKYVWASSKPYFEASSFKPLAKQSGFSPCSIRHSRSSKKAVYTLMRSVGLRNRLSWDGWQGLASQHLLDRLFIYLFSLRSEPLKRLRDGPYKPRKLFYEGSRGRGLTPNEIFNGREQ